MKITVQIVGCSELPAAFGGCTKVPLDFSGSTAAELMQQLSDVMGPERREIFFSDQGAISSDLAILVNGIMISDSNRGNFRLKEGDSVELISSPG